MRPTLSTTILLAALLCVTTHGCVFFAKPNFVDGSARDTGIDATLTADANDSAPLDGPCAPGRLDCDGNPANGCETAESAVNCGRCDAACALASAVARCAAGRCVVDRCVESFGDCDSDPSNGCEQRLDTVAHCGACNRACSGATPSCVDGRCASGCPAGQQRCDGACIDTMSSNDHCGSCGRRCGAAANGQQQCVAGTCVLSCTSGFADCNRDPADGCEVRLGTSDNCGGCGQQCRGMTPTCNASTGMCTGALCGSPLIMCGGSCVDPNTSTMHCGRCDVACASAPNTMTSCVSGSCRNPCLVGFGDCTMAPGCETPLNTADNCGACATRCSFANATAACVDRRCVMGACNAGFGDCDMNPTNGCETPLDTVRNCGRCNLTCASMRNTPVCAGGTCRIGVCAPGFGDCDADPTNGCETSLESERNCGACGLMCPTRPGGCAATCVSGDPPRCDCV